MPSISMKVRLSPSYCVTGGAKTGRDRPFASELRPVLFLENGYIRINVLTHLRAVVFLAHVQVGHAEECGDSGAGLARDGRLPGRDQDGVVGTE